MTWLDDHLFGLSGELWLKTDASNWSVDCVKLDEPYNHSLVMSLFSWQDSSRKAHGLNSNRRLFQPVINWQLTKCGKGNTLRKLKVVGEGLCYRYRYFRFQYC